MSRWTKRRITEYSDACFEVARDRITADPTWWGCPDVRLIPERLDVCFYPSGSDMGGEYVHFPRHLVFNYELLSYHGTKCCEDMIAHEVAHAVTDSIFGDQARAHGKEWREIALMLGSEATRFHYYSFDHIALRHPDKFFLYATKDERYYEWYNQAEIRANAFRVMCDGKRRRMYPRPDLKTKVARMKCPSLLQVDS